MISGTDILAAVKSKEIRVGYSYLPTTEGSKTFEYVGKCLLAEEEGTRAHQYFQSKVIRDRLALSAGRVYRPFNPKKVSKSNRFDGHQQLVDLECTPTYMMEPGESGIVVTNEWVQFGSNHSALIVSRVSNYTNGLVIKAAYIDSNFSGLLRFVVTNVSSYPLSLKIGQDLGRMFVFKTNNPESQDNILADVSAHFGLNWPTIISDGLNPFQELGGQNKTDTFEQISDWLKSNIQKIGYASFAATVASAILYLYVSLNTLSSLEDRTKKLETYKSSADKRIEKIEGKNWVSGRFLLEFDIGEFDKEKKILIKTKGTDSDPVLLIESVEGFDVTGQISEHNDEKIEMSFKVHRKSNDLRQSMIIKWVVLSS